MTMAIVLVVVTLVVCGAFGAYLLNDIDGTVFGGVLGLLLGPVGVIVAAIVRGNASLARIERELAPPPAHPVSAKRTKEARRFQ